VLQRHDGLLEDPDPGQLWCRTGRKISHLGQSYNRNLHKTAYIRLVLSISNRRQPNSYLEGQIRVERVVLATIQISLSDQSMGAVHKPLVLNEGIEPFSICFGFVERLAVLEHEEDRFPPEII
jgi:hypothetical protein